MAAQKNLQINFNTVNDAIHRIRPSEDCDVVTPADGADLTTPATQLYIGGAGNIKIDTLAGNTRTLVGIPAGTILPISVKRVYSTGTTATNIIALHD